MIPIMKKLILSLALSLLCVAGSCSRTENPYYFDGSVSQAVLERYLARAVTMSEFLTVDPYCNDGTYPDKAADVAFIRNTVQSSSGGLFIAGEMRKCSRSRGSGPVPKHWSGRYMPSTPT